VLIARARVQWEANVSETLSARLFVTIGRGLTVRLEAVQLLLNLESRGVKFTTDHGDIVFHAPAKAVTDEDRAALRRFKPHVLALLDYCEREARQ